MAIVCTLWNWCCYAETGDIAGARSVIMEFFFVYCCQVSRGTPLIRGGQLGARRSHGVRNASRWLFRDPCHLSAYIHQLNLLLCQCDMDCDVFLSLSCLIMMGCGSKLMSHVWVSFTDIFFVLSWFLVIGMNLEGRQL